MNTQPQLIEEQEPVLEFNRSTYEEVCKELKEVLTLEKDIANRKADLKKSIIDLSGGERMEYGIKIQKRVVKGTIDYKQIVVDLGLTEDESEAYRKDTRTYWDVRGY